MSQFSKQWEKQVLLLSATYELDDNLANCKILTSSKLKGDTREWFDSKYDHIEMET